MCGCLSVQPIGFIYSKIPQNCLIVDTRSPDVYVKGCIPKSINCSSVMPQFQKRLSLAIPQKMKVIIVSDQQKIAQTVTRMLNAGIAIIGWLQGGVQRFKKQGGILQNQQQVLPEYLAKQTNLCILDVRQQHQVKQNGKLKGSINFPLQQLLNDLNNNGGKLLKQKVGNKKLYIHCRTGMRSCLAVSSLKRFGITNVVQINGGFDRMKKDNIPIQK